MANYFKKTHIYINLLNWIFEGKLGVSLNEEFFY